MFLESVLQLPNLDESAMQMLNLVVSQLNLLLCLVNDVLDLKLIKMDKYQSKIESFKPTDTLEFIKAMFRPQAEMQNCKISYQTVTIDSLKTATIHGHCE